MNASGGDRDSSKRRRWHIGQVMAVAIASAVVATAISVPASVWASHRFADVPSSNPFHDDIDWMAGTGISEGYDDGTFRPEQPVSRQAMSAFMRRAFDLRDPIETFHSDQGFSFNTKDWVAPRVDTSLDVVVPPGTTAHLMATFNARATCGTAECNGAITLDGSVVKSAWHCEDCQFEPFTLVYVSPEPVGPGTYTFEFQGKRERPTGDNTEWSLYQVHFVAEARLLPS